MVIIMVQQENALRYLNNVTHLQRGMVLAADHQEVELFVLKVPTIKERNVIHMKLVRMDLYGMLII
jgi:hypothetical protein